MVPLLLQTILAELTKRGILEQGLLRKASQKQKIETLYEKIEKHFYRKPENIVHLVKKAGVHELGAFLKRWLRELPEPLLRNDLVQHFFQTSVVPPEDQRINKMTSLNVATIIAPSFFPPRFLHLADQNDIGAQVRYGGHVLSADGRYNHHVQQLMVSAPASGRAEQKEKKEWTAKRSSLFCEALEANIVL